VDPIHIKAVELMPWYINGTLPESEREELDKHFGDCLPCRAALKQERRMQELIRRQSEVPLSSEHGMADLVRRIDGKRAGLRSAGMGWRLAFAASLVFCIVTGTWMLGLWESQLDSFSTLTTSGESRPPTLIDIVFGESVTEAEIREIIRGIDGQLVAGPSELGRYTVSVATYSGDETKSAIESLSGDPRIQFVGRNFIAPDSAEAENER
jgi:hypothetical protein